MTKRIYIILVSLLCGLILFSCDDKEKKPFGAEVIDYDKVEGINKEGPTIETNHIENQPPVGNKTTFVEVGPPHVDYPEIKVEPTADMDLEPDYGGIPVVIKGNNGNGS